MRLQKAREHRHVPTSRKIYTLGASNARKRYVCYIVCEFIINGVCAAFSGVRVHPKRTNVVATSCPSAIMMIMGCFVVVVVSVPFSSSSFGLFVLVLVVPTR